MSKWVDRIMDEVYDKFDRHLHEYDERMEFLSELIRELEEALEAYIEYLGEELRINDDLMVSETIDEIELAEDLIVKINKNE